MDIYTERKEGRKEGIEGGKERKEGKTRKPS